MRSHWLLDPALSRTVHITGMRKRWVTIANIKMFTSCRPICQLVRSRHKTQGALSFKSLTTASANQSPSSVTYWKKCCRRR